MVLMSQEDIKEKYGDSGFHTTKEHSSKSKSNCLTIDVGIYPETFAFQLFIFMYSFFCETFEFPKK